MLDNLPELQLPKRGSGEPQLTQDQSSIWFHSQTLPLLHVTVSETKILLPVSNIKRVYHTVSQYPLHCIRHAS